MTGFGRGSGEVYGHRCTVEVRSVNHRFLDLKLRLHPPWLDPVIEQLIAQAVRKRVDRGSLVLTVREEGVAQAEPVVRVDTELGRAHGRALRELARALGLLPVVHGPAHAAPLSHTAHGLGHPLDGLGEALGAQLLGLVAAQPGVLLFGESNSDPEGRFQLLEPILGEALSHLLACREREGQALSQELTDRLSQLSGLLAEVAQLTAAVPEQHRRRLSERIARLVDGGAGPLPVLDPQRLMQEVALYADRLDVTEEIARLRAHLSEFDRLCRSEALAGRRLDFLTQEINREVNTIGAKAQSAEVAARVVAMKTEVERLREQIQNVE